MNRAVRFFVILGVGLLAIDSALFALKAMDRPTEAVTQRAILVSSPAAAIGGPFALTTSDGKPVSDKTYRGKWLLIYFGYTFCPDACPTALTNISIAVQTLRQAAGRFQPLFITIDPERDTAVVLREYLKSFDPRIVGLTGSEEQTTAAARSYRVYVKPHKVESDNYVVDHSSYVYVVAPDGKFVDVIEGTTPGDEMAKTLQKLVAEHST